MAKRPEMVPLELYRGVTDRDPRRAGTTATVWGAEESQRRESNPRPAVYGLAVRYPNWSF